MVFIKVLISIIIGYILGWERKKQDKSGGSRTMAMVSLGACAIALLTQKIVLINPEIHNYSRLMAYGIASIGFLGSGVIIQRKGHIDGLTTASTLFALLPINYFIGLGYIIEGIIGAILMYIILDSKYWDWSKLKHNVG